LKSLRTIPSELIWVSLAPLLYAGMSASAKLAGTHLTVWQVAAGRFGLGLLVVPVIIRALGLGLWGRRRFLLTLRGLCGATSFMLLVASLQRIPLSMAMVLFYLYPAFTAILSPWLIGEPTPAKAWPFVGGAFLGTSLILWPGGDSGGLDLGHAFAVVASVLCAVTLILVRRLGRENNVYTLFFYLCLTGTLASLGPLLTQEAPLLPSQAVAWAEVAAVAVFSIGAQLSINQALVRIPAPQVSVMMTVEVPLVACFGVVCLGEPLGWRLLTGALLIFASGVGLNLLPARSTGTGGA